jgi:hypothetical protein
MKVQDIISLAELKKTKADLAQAVLKNTAMEKALTEAQVKIKSESKESVAAMSSVVQDNLAASQKAIGKEEIHGDIFLDHNGINRWSSSEIPHAWR